MTLRRILVTILLTLALGAGGYARDWEPVRAERGDAKVVLRDTEMEVKSAPGIIQVYIARPAQVKIFTILGRLISSETVNSGLQQFQVPTHGVYIVQIGTKTCKVAV